MVSRLWHSQSLTLFMHSSFIYHSPAFSALPWQLHSLECTDQKKKKKIISESPAWISKTAARHQWEASHFLPKRKGTFRAKPCCCSVCLDPAKTFNHTDWWGAFSWLEASPSTASIPAVHQPCNPFIKALIVLRYTWPWNAGSHTPSSLIMQQNQPASLKWHF